MHEVVDAADAEVIGVAKGDEDLVVAIEWLAAVGGPGIVPGSRAPLSRS